MSTSSPLASGNLPQQAQGGQPWMGNRYNSRTYFAYESDIVSALNAGTSQNLSFNIAGDSDFFWTKFSVFALVGGAATNSGAVIVPAVTLLIINTTTGRQYSSAPVPMQNIAGIQAGLPFILPQITLWQAKATIQIQLLNEGNANYSNLHLTFHGVKAFLAGGS
jgi:hypothetical protein